MVISFREILRRAAAKLSNTSTSTSEDNDLYPKLKDWANERYERIYETFPWRSALNPTTLQIVASQVEYALERDIGKIWSTYDQTNGRVIKESDVQGHIRFFAEDLDMTGNVAVDDPRRYYPVGEFTVKAEIGSSAEKVKIASTESGDTTPNVVAVTGLVSSAELTETIVLNGTSDVVSSNTFDANQKLRVVVGTNNEARKSVTGVITLSGNTSATVLSVISPKEFAPLHKWIRVSATPKASGTQPVWLIWYSKRIQQLNNDNDIPIIDVGNALVEGILAEGLWEDGQDAQAQIHEQKFAALVNEKQLADTGPNLIEQFVPSDQNLISTLDYGRVIGGPE